MSGRRFLVRLIWHDTGQPVADCALDAAYDHGVPQVAGDLLVYAEVPMMRVVQRVWGDSHIVWLRVCLAADEADAGVAR